MIVPLSAAYLFMTVLVVSNVTSATRVCNVCWPSEIFTQPAIGLEFGPSYGRAVFKWPNKTVEEVVTIQGNQEYTAAMLEIAGFPGALQDHEPSRGALLKEQGAAAAVPNSDSSMTTVKPFILTPMAAMARQLRDALDRAPSPTPLSILGVTYPVFFKESHRKFLQASVQRTAGLQPSLSYYQTNSAVASAAANDVQLCQCPQFARGCSEEEQSLEDAMILAIDYSDVLLTAFLYRDRAPEGQGIVITRRTLPLHSHDKDRETMYWNAVARDLTELMSRNMLGRRLDHLVMSGSRAGDSNLHSAIQSGIGALGYHRSYHYSADSKISSNSENLTLTRISMESMTSPALAAAQGVADLSWRRTMRTCIGPCSQWRLLPPCYDEPGFGRS